MDAPQRPHGRGADQQLVTSLPNQGEAAERRSRWPWPAQVLVCAVLLLAAAMASAPLVLVPGIERLDAPGTPMWLVVLVLAGTHLITLVVAVAGVALLARLDGRRRLRDMGWRWDRRSLSLLGLGTLVSVVVVLAVGVPLGLAGALRPTDSGIDGIPWWAALVVGLSQALLLQAIPEELIFRGYLLGSLRMRPLPAVLVSGLSFGVLHLVSSGGQQGWVERVLYLAMPIGFGLAAGALMLLTRSLWVAVGIHGGLHLTLLAVALIEQAVPAVALHGGPAFWVLTGLGWTTVAALAMARLPRDSNLPVQAAT